MTHESAAFPPDEGELFGTRPSGTHERHQAAVARTLGWADEAARRHDFHDALAWLKTLEATGEILPDHYQRKQEEWTRCACANVTAEAVQSCLPGTSPHLGRLPSGP
ncbi:MAG TPA: hypothetical protein VII98_14130 [Solirubrobacteraceae bacterium]